MIFSYIDKSDYVLVLLVNMQLKIVLFIKIKKEKQ